MLVSILHWLYLDIWWWTIFRRRSIQIGELDDVDVDVVVCGRVCHLVFSHDVSHESLQNALGPVRMYYRLMRGWYGGKKSVFDIVVKDGMHPWIVYYKRYSEEIRTVTLLSEQVIPSICLLLGFFVIDQIFCRLKGKKWIFFLNLELYSCVIFSFSRPLN